MATDRTRCTCQLRSGEQCPKQPRFAGMCQPHAAAARVPEALEAQRAALQSKKAKRDANPFVKYLDDPVAFAIECLGTTPWSRECDFLRAVAAHDYVTLKAGQKVSKSHALAILMTWYATTRPGARVFYTNSSERQVFAVNYRELRRIIRGAKVDLGIKHTHDTPGRGVTFKTTSEIVGFKTDEVDRMGGLSSEVDMLFIVDEASGVPSSLFEAIHGNLAGGGKMILTGNPLRPSDYFFDTHNSRAGSWHCMTISSLESPNVVEGREVIRGLASAKFIERTRAEWGDGPGSPFWMARILGEFPTHSEYSVIPLGDALASAARAGTPADTSAPLVVGLDVGRYGDDESVACYVRGHVVVGMHAWRNCDGPTLASRVVETAAEYRQGNERMTANIDVIGVGSSPYDAIKNYGWVDAVPVAVSEKPTVENFYLNLRAQLWFECAAWLKTGCIPNDSTLIAELTVPMYSFVGGKRKIEDKAEIKRRLKRSPDRADALCLALHCAREMTQAELWADVSVGDLEEVVGSLRGLAGPHTSGWR